MQWRTDIGPLTAYLLRTGQHASRPDAQSASLILSNLPGPTASAAIKRCFKGVRELNPAPGPTIGSFYFREDPSQPSIPVDEHQFLARVALRELLVPLGDVPWFVVHHPEENGCHVVFSTLRWDGLPLPKQKFGWNKLLRLAELALTACRLNLDSDTRLRVCKKRQALLRGERPAVLPLTKREEMYRKKHGTSHREVITAALDQLTATRRILSDFVGRLAQLSIGVRLRTDAKQAVSGISFGWTDPNSHQPWSFKGSTLGARYSWSELRFHVEVDPISDEPLISRLKVATLPLPDPMPRAGPALEPSPSPFTTRHRSRASGATVELETIDATTPPLKRQDRIDEVPATGEQRQAANNEREADDFKDFDEQQRERSLQKPKAGFDPARTEDTSKDSMSGWLETVKHRQQQLDLMQQLTRATGAAPSETADSEPDAPPHDQPLDRKRGHS